MYLSFASYKYGNEGTLNIRNKHMKRGYYIYYTTKAGLVGVDQKVENQSKIFRQYFSFEKIAVERQKSNFIKSVIWRLPMGSFGRNYDAAFSKIQKPDFIYIRFVPADRGFLRFIKSLRRRYPSAKLLLEVSTYPYARELLSDVSMLPYYFKDLYYHRQLKKYVDRVVTFSDDSQIFGIPTIRTINGIIVQDQKMVQTASKEDDIIRLLAVALFQKSHGYERCIRGLYDYYKQGGNRKIEIHMVGDGTELSFYKKVVKKYQMEKYITFYGRQSGAKLDELYEKADIALGCFGLYKRKIKKISSLKIGEYLSRGLPVIIGGTERAFEGKEMPYVCEFSNDDAPIDMNIVAAFYDRVYNRGMDRGAIHREIREYARRTVDMERVMQPIIEWILQE